MTADQIDAAMRRIVEGKERRTGERRVEPQPFGSPVGRTSWSERSIGRDRRAHPALAEFAYQERAGLLARVELLESEVAHLLLALETLSNGVPGLARDIPSIAEIVAQCRARTALAKAAPK